MSIQMIGIDYKKASVDIRSLFAFTKKHGQSAMEWICTQEGVSSCVILSTCNRTEVWIHSKSNRGHDLVAMVCQIKGLSEEQYRKYFTGRLDADAVSYLFSLTSGMESQIFAEDQIITQVKDSLALSRECYCTDHVMEVLFRTAVTAAKRIKTDVVLSHGNVSVIHNALFSLKKHNFDVKDKVCMVIGNGEMGRLTAQTLQSNGADVTVTVRQYKSGMVAIPEACKRIHYGERMELVNECDLIVSATASPNYTLTREAFASIKRTKPLIIIDLAVPRDVEPSLNELPYIQLYDIDSFQSDQTKDDRQPAVDDAQAIILHYLEQFYHWYEGKDLFPRIEQIKQSAQNDFRLRIEGTLKKSSLTEEERERIKSALEQATGKVINKMLYGMRDNMNTEEFTVCLEGLEKLYES